MLPMHSARNCLLLVWALWIRTAVGQSASNPAFWQSPRTYNASGAMAQVSSRTLVALSNDFQTISPGNDLPVSPRRLVFDYSYACNSTNTTFDQLQQINNNNMRYGTVPNVPTIALIERGHCNWSEKLAVASTLASANNLNLSAVLFFDNTTQTSAEYRLYSEDELTTFVANDPLPDSRNITKMSDNDLSDRGTPPIPVYFAPKTYGDQFRKFIATANNTGSEKEFWQLSSILVPFSDKNNEDGSPFSRGYLSYVIALAAIFLVALFAGVVFLRWWRARQMRDQMEYEAQLSAHAYNLQMRMQAKPLPVDIVNSIPISKYTIEAVKNANCAICLEDYAENVNEVRILGCGHGFCVLCIDPWLTQKSTMCPICKWDCLPPELRNQEDDPEATLSAPQSNPAPHVAVVIANPVAESSTSGSRAATPASASTTAAGAPVDESTKEAKKSETKDGAIADKAVDTKTVDPVNNDSATTVGKETEKVKDGAIHDTAADVKSSATTADPAITDPVTNPVANQSDTDDRQDSEDVAAAATTSENKDEPVEVSKRNSSDSRHRP